MDIKDLREEIDALDEKIVELICRRMEASAHVAEYKRENKLPVLDSSRERELLARVGELAGEEFSGSVRVLYTSMLDVSRSYQHKKLSEKSELAHRMEDAVKNTPKMMTKSAVVACQGVEGAYSQIACEKLFSDPSIMYFGSFEGVFQAVEKGLCRYGVLPIENSTAGSVNKIYDLMDKFKFYIVRGVRLQVGHALLAPRGVKVSDVREIMSHEQAISQCSEFLREHPEISVTKCDNTAIAARNVAESGRRDLAALSSPACAELYDLSTLFDNVCDYSGNYTRFICISKNLEIYPGANRTSLMMRIPHKPGSLHRIIARFQTLGINLEKLESRPKPGSDFEVIFYFDVGASIYSSELYELLCELERDVDGFKYLGSYSETI